MTIENTSSRDTLDHVAGSLIQGTSGYIEGMEADGQRQLVNSTLLPAEAHGLNGAQNGWPQFEALGFVKGDPVDGDELFVNATLPDGWSRSAGEHSMWSYIVDDRGINRVAIFYKAAFYDRRAHMGLVNPGSELASAVLYSDEPAALPEQWPVLTDRERDDFRARIDRCIADAKRHPKIYGDLKPRAKALAELIDNQ